MSEGIGREDFSASIKIAEKRCGDNKETWQMMDIAI
jgi:hypothetical protein